MVKINQAVGCRLAEGKKVRHERMVTSQVTSKALGHPPSVSSWLHTGKNSRASHETVRGGLFRKETHSIDGVWAISEGKRGSRFEVVRFYRGG